jgi:two-component system sensor histidine kinase KdpD
MDFLCSRRLRLPGRGLQSRAVKRRLLNALLKYLACAAIVAAITAIYVHLLPVNPTTVALTLLLSVLAIAAAWSLRHAVFTSLLATAAFNYFFLPPVGTWTIAETQNWVALFVFLVTAIIASQLSERARAAAVAADRRRYEVEQLYRFSQQLLVRENVLELLNAIPRQIVEEFSATAAALYHSTRDQVYYSDVATRSLISADDLKAVAGRGEPSADPHRGVAFMPVRMGVRSVGSIGVVGTLSREMLEAISSLVAIAVERAGAVEKLTRAEASRESEQLRSALLDAVTHDFRTPLTGIKAAVTSLTSGVPLDETQRRELLAVIDEEADRINRLVGEAAEMAQFEADRVQLDFQRRGIAEPVKLAVEELGTALAGRTVEVKIAPDLPPARLDVRRICEVLRHLLDNAAKYSPPGAPIVVSAERAGKYVRVNVTDRGAGIDDFEQSLIFEKFYRGRGQRSVQGTGMGLAIARAIIEAHGGTIGVTSQLGHGSVFWFTVPLA